MTSGTSKYANDVLDDDHSAKKIHKNTFPLELWIMIISKLDVATDWEALLACWSIVELKPVLRRVYQYWRFAIVAYQYSRNQCIELGIQCASSHHSYIVNLVSNRVNVNSPLTCRVLSSCLLENLLINNLTTLNVKSVVLLREFLLDEGYIRVKTGPETVGETLFLLDCSRSPAYVGIRVVAVNSGMVTINVPSHLVDVFRQLNIHRLQDERCRGYTVRPFSEAVITLEKVMNLWLSRHEDYLRKNHRPEFGQNYSANYSKRIFPDDM